MVSYYPVGKIHSSYKPDEPAEIGKSTVKWLDTLCP